MIRYAVERTEMGKLPRRLAHRHIMELDDIAYKPTITIGWARDSKVARSKAWWLKSVRDKRKNWNWLYFKYLTVIQNDANLSSYLSLVESSDLRKNYTCPQTHVHSDRNPLRRARMCDCPLWPWTTKTILVWSTVCNDVVLWSWTALGKLPG